MSTTSRDYYDILGVPRDADEAAIKKAFRRLARENHPDVNQGDPGAEERFKEIAEAYEVLSNPEARQTYDRFGKDGLNNQGFNADFSGFGSFGDLFSSLFGSDIFGARGPVAQAGDDHLVETTITFVESATGVGRELDVDLVVMCDTCDGSGGAPGAEIVTCATCGGQGQVQQVVRSPLGQLMRRTQCPECRGAGRYPSTPCDECRGLGRRMATRTVSLEIPAGIADGQRIRMPGKAHAGDPGAPNGDLYVEVRVAPDGRFMRDELDILSVVQIGVADAMTGTSVSVPTVEGEVEITLAPGTQPLAEHILKGKGFPQIQGRRRGDQRVIVHVDIPAVTSTEGHVLLEQLAHHHEVPKGKGKDKGAGDGILGRIRSRFR